MQQRRKMLILRSMAFARLGIAFVRQQRSLAKHLHSSAGAVGEKNFVCSLVPLTR
jgi:hypothetical protein